MRIQMVDDSEIPVNIEIQQIVARTSSDGKKRFVDAKIVVTELDSNGQAVTLILGDANRKRLIRALKAL